jgi:Cu+-exporting ATPase
MGFKSETGRGVQAEVDGIKIMIGNQKMLMEHGINPDGVLPLVKDLQYQAKTVVFTVIDNKLSGLIGIADTTKDGANEVITRLKQMNLSLVMITGDNQHTGESIARQSGIGRVIAEVMPGDIKRMKLKSFKTMVKLWQWWGTE